MIVQEVMLIFNFVAKKMAVQFSSRSLGIICIIHRCLLPSKTSAAHNLSKIFSFKWKDSEFYWIFILLYFGMVVFNAINSRTVFETSTYISYFDHCILRSLRRRKKTQSLWSNNASTKRTVYSKVLISWILLTLCYKKIYT